MLECSDANVTRLVVLLLQPLYAAACNDFIDSPELHSLTHYKKKTQEKLRGEAECANKFKSDNVTRVQTD